MNDTIVTGSHVKFLPGLNRKIKFVSRDSLRSKHKHYRLNPYALDPFFALRLPTPPADIDWSKKNTLSFPIDGNDTYGDCFMADVAHHSNAMTGNVGQEDSFDAQALIKDYLKLSGGDNGLSPDQIYPYWKNGILGSAHKIYDVLQVDPANPTAMKLAIWAFGGVDFTLGIPDQWLANIQAGMTWDSGRGVKSDPQNGHAVYISGIQGGIYQVQTWGLNPPVQLTQGGVGVCDPEAYCVFSPDWFNEDGMAPNGMSYVQLSQLWQQLGGQTVPPWNGPAPTPTPQPGPTPGPTPTPTPGPSPTPGPTPGGLQAVIDQLFAQLEAQLTGHPFFLRLLEQLQKEIDSLFSHQQFSTSVRSKSGLSPAQIRQLADVVLGILQTVFVANPTVLAIITAIKTILDSLIPSSK